MSVALKSRNHVEALPIPLGYEAVVRVESQGEFLPSIALLDLVPRPAGALAFLMRDVEQGYLGMVA